MKINEMTEWLKVEFMPLMLATPDQTIDQLVKNAIRYFNNNSAVKYVEMVDVGAKRSTVSQMMKSVAYVYPAVDPNQLQVQDFPLWTLLGIQVLDGLTSDLIMLTETYKSFMAYMGKDFQWSWMCANNPEANPYSENLGTALSGTLTYKPLVAGTLILTRGVETFTDNGDGTLTSDQSGGGTGTINYTTGAWAVTGWIGTATITAAYSYYAGGFIYYNNVPPGSNKLCVVGCRRVLETEDISNGFILDFILRYSKALLKMSEGNILRKASIINVANDGQTLLEEGKEEIEKLQAELRANGRWIAFSNRI